MFDGLPESEHAVARMVEATGEALQAARTLHCDSGGWIVVKLGARGALAVGPGGTELTEGP